MSRYFPLVDCALQSVSNNSLAWHCYLQIPHCTSLPPSTRLARFPQSFGVTGFQRSLDLGLCFLLCATGMTTLTLTLSLTRLLLSKQVIHETYVEKKVTKQVIILWTVKSFVLRTSVFLPPCLILAHNAKIIKWIWAWEADRLGFESFVHLLLHAILSSCLKF